jgi:tetratricopeptide (TPR) repeat protein
LTAGVAAAQTVQAEPALVHHAISTNVPAAQEAFDEGLTLIYAFNRDEAEKRFRRAATLDPSLAMAYWGIALAEGPNINFPTTPERLKIANDALVRAKALEASAQPEERAYVDALALRYPSNPKAPPGVGYVAYRTAMQQLHAAYPVDDDAAALYVESSMDVDDWGWHEGKPQGVTAQLMATLETVLQRNPDHIGANHYYVHLTDAAGEAQRAVPSADRLSVLPIEPAASHLVHMAGHTDLDVGRFASLEREGRRSVEADLAYASLTGVPPTKLDYFEHNMDFWMGGALLLDDREEAQSAIDVARAKGVPAAIVAYANEGRWSDVMGVPAPDAKDSGAQLDYHYARALAFVAAKDAGAAQSEIDALRSSGGYQGYREALVTLASARLEHLRGDDAAALSALRGLIAKTADYPPEVFPPWFFPAGTWVGWILFDQGDLQGSETAFRADLQRTPNNARSLFGLMQALGREGRTSEAGALASDLAANWRGPEADLRVTEI